MIPIYCPACGARMFFDKAYTDDIRKDAFACHLQCPKCLLSGPIEYSDRAYGAAIKAGRAMRRICRAVETRQADRENASFAHGIRIGKRDHARAILMLLHDHKLTRRQITERMRQEATL